MAEQKLERIETVVKKGVQVLANFLGYDDYSKRDVETGEVKLSIGYHFLKSDGMNARGTHSNPEVITFWDKSADYLDMKNFKFMQPVGLSLTISSGQGGNLFTQVQGILSAKRTALLIQTYELDKEEDGNK